MKPGTRVEVTGGERGAGERGVISTEPSVWPFRAERVRLDGHHPVDILRYDLRELSAVEQLAELRIQHVWQALKRAHAAHAPCEMSWRSATCDHLICRLLAAKYKSLRGIP